MLVFRKRSCTAVAVAGLPRTSRTSRLQRLRNAGAATRLLAKKPIPWLWIFYTHEHLRIFEYCISCANISTLTFSVNTYTCAAYRLCLITFREIWKRINARWNGVLLIPLISPRRVVIASRSLYYVNTVRLIKPYVISSAALSEIYENLGRGCSVEYRFFRSIRKNSAAKRFRVISRCKVERQV